MQLLKIKKKLELSFAPESAKWTPNKKKEINKSVKPEVQISGKADFKTVSINTEVNKTQYMSKETPISTAVKTGSRYKKVIPRTANTLKSKATFCLDLVATEQLTAIYIKRLKSQQKSDRSSLICEAISLLYEKEGV